MRAKIIHTRADDRGVLHLVVPDLPPGEVEVVVLIPENEDKRRLLPGVDRLPLGGYRVGYLSPGQLRREAMYEENQ